MNIRYEMACFNMPNNFLPKHTRKKERKKKDKDKNGRRKKEQKNNNRTVCVHGSTVRISIEGNIRDILVESLACNFPLFQLIEAKKKKKGVYHNLHGSVCPHHKSNQIKSKIL